MIYKGGNTFSIRTMLRICRISLKLQIDFEFFHENRIKNINADGNPDSNFHCVLGSAKKCFDAQILFDPFLKNISIC